MKTGKKSLNLALTTALFCAIPISQAAESLFDIGIGARSERFHWSISGDFDGTSPNILSELIWNNVNIVELSLNSDIRTNSGVRVQTHLAVGSIEDAHVRDSDYLGDGRTSEFSRSIADSEGDGTLDFSLSVGYELSVTDTDSTTVTPFAGINYREADFDITKGFQAIDVFGGTAGSAIPGLNSSYDTEWHSTFLGVQLDHRGHNWHVFGRFEYHDFDYEAVADWNLRTDFAHPVSFIHDSDGAGPVYAIGARRMINNNWNWFVNYTWWNWDADNGSDTTFFSDGTAARTHVKTAVSDGNTLYFGVSYTPTGN